MQKNNILSHTKILSQCYSFKLVCVCVRVCVYLPVLVCLCACMCVSECVAYLCASNSHVKKNGTEKKRHLCSRLHNF